MNFIKEYSGVVALVILAIMGVSGYFGSASKMLFGSTSCGTITCLSGGLRLVADAGGDFESDIAAVFNSTFQLGTNGTSLTEIKSGTCTIFAYATTIAASTTGQVDCQAGASSLLAISGIQSGDRVFAGLASTTVATFQGLSIQWVAASTTNGYITMKIFNGTGTTFSWASTASSGIPYLVTR